MSPPDAVNGRPTPTQRCRNPWRGSDPSIRVPHCDLYYACLRHPHAVLRPSHGPCELQGV